MQTLFLPDAAPTKDQTNFRLDLDVRESESPFVGTVLAGRYKILEAIDAETFKAHDLAFDQTVTVRERSPASQSGCDTWRKKARQLASVRNPNFLNVLDVISERSREFVISERHRGKSIAELLEEGSRFGLDDVFALMAPLAGALDLAATFACVPNQISVRWLFQEARRSSTDDPKESSPRELPPFFIKLDVWELVRPRKNISPPFLNWRAPKAGSKRLAVRYVATLTYELFGAETGEETQVKRWFKPVGQLRDAGNSILCRGLQGSPFFRTGESFFHRLDLVIRSGANQSTECYEAMFQTRDQTFAYPGANDVLRRFNRDTEWLAIGLLGAVFLTAMAFAVLLPEHYQRAPDVAREARQARSYSLPNAEGAIPFAVADLNTKRFPRGANPETLTRVDQELAEISSKQPAQIEAGTKAAPSSVLAPRTETDRTFAQRNGSKWSSIRRQDPAVIRGKIGLERSRSSGRPKFFGVKMQLIALWHRSLLQNEKLPGWEIFPNSNRKKKTP
jgi:hypothetical protein